MSFESRLKIIEIFLTALGIEDFSYSTKYFSFDSNTIIDCIDLSITADMIKENPENFSLTLFETEDTVVVSEDVLNITIISDDGK